MTGCQRWLHLVPLAALLLLAASPAPAQEDPTTARGFQADKVYQVGDVDHVNVWNGNVLLTLPIGPTYPLGGELGYGLTLTWNANFWDMEHWCQAGEPGNRCFTRAEPAPGSTAGAGWNLGFGRLLRPATDLNENGPWSYVAADGGRHSFHPTLHPDDPDDNPPPPDPPNADPDDQIVGYTRDGSYLRMLKEPDGRRRVAFPDGSYQIFAAPEEDAPEWLLERLTDRFGNHLDVTYLPTPTSWDRWQLSDQHGRTHTVHFESTSYSDFPVRVSEVRLAAFGDLAEAVYTFSYTEATVARSCPHNDPNVTDPVTIPLLSSVTQPDGSSWGFDYFTPSDVGCSNLSGRIQGVDLPTLGRIEYGYQAYVYPFREEDVVMPPNASRPPSTTGVATRTLLDRDGTVVGEWSYAPQLTPTTPPEEPNEFVVEVTDPQGNRTEHFFSADRDGFAWEGDWTIYDYGLPFTRSESVTALDPLSGETVDLYLSTRVYAAGESEPLRSSYLRYERDAYQGPLAIESVGDANRRVVAERTVYHDDGTSTESFRGDFDGLGHHRDEFRRGSFQQDPGRSMHVHYNPGRGSYSVDSSGDVEPGFTMLPITSPWILGTSTYQQVSEEFQSARVGEDPPPEGTVPTLTSRVETVYDADTGALECRRTLESGSTDPPPARGSDDVLEVFERDADGNVITESVYGGDLQTLGTGAGCEVTGTLHAAYRKVNDYENGVLSRSAWVNCCDGAGDGTDVLVTADRDVDADTGLIATSRDEAGYPTEFAYDEMGRLTEVRPLEEAWTLYEYTPADADLDQAARVDVTRQESATSAALTESRILFDDFGRVCKELERLPGGWSKRLRSYLATGWPSAVTEQVSAAGAEVRCSSSLAAFPRTRFLAHDPFGRAGRIVAADGEETTVAHLGVRQVKRTVDVATGTGGTESGVETIERYDPHGRLRRVVQTLGTGDAAETIETSYAYEVGNQLNHGAVYVDGVLHQERYWSYDRRGFLLWDKHPERVQNPANAHDPSSDDGKTFYEEHDALGNAHRRYDASRELTFDFDPAQRPTRALEVDGAESRPLEEFSYHRTNRPGEWSRGKLYQAKRHNYGSPVAPLELQEADLVVTESYRYAGVGGRVSSRQTRLANLGTAVFEQSFEYDLLGNRSRTVYPRCQHAPCAGTDPIRSVSFTRTRGRLTGVGGYATSITYHPNGLVDDVAHANGVTDSQDADPSSLRRPEKITVTGPLVSWTTGEYAFDGAGNVKSIGGDVYRYDELSRVVESTVLGRVWSFGYDPHGNVTSITRDGVASSYPVEPRTNRLVSASYDGSGNLLLTSLGGQTQQYDYDGLNMLRSVQSSSEAKGFIYTADDERLVEWDFTTDPWTLSWSIRDLDGKVLRRWEETGGGGSGSWRWDQDYVYRDGLLLASESTEGTRHYHLDHLGTPRVLTDGNGAEVARHTYFPFGEEATDPSQDGERMKFTGHERDRNGASSADDLDYMHRRYYSPRLGRFLSVDPASSGEPKAPQSWHRYAYGLNNPVRYVDPNGEAAVDTTRFLERNRAIVSQLDSIPVVGGPLSSAAEFLLPTTASEISIDPADFVTPFASVVGSSGKLALRVTHIETKLRRVFRRTLTVDTAVAAGVERAGGTVAEKASGVAFDHVTKFVRARAGVTKKLDALKRLASDPRLPAELREVATDLLGEFSKKLDQLEEILEAAARGGEILPPQ